MNLWGFIKGLLVQDETDRTKELALEVDPAAASGTRTTIKAAQTVDRELTLPDSDSQIADVDSPQTFENKTMDFSTGGTNSLVADAVDIKYDNTASSLTAINTQDAIDEVEGRVDTVETGLSDHLADASDAHDASAISNVPAGTIIATDVQAAINELDSDRQQVSTDLANHIADISDAHDASAISNVPSGNLVATDVQAALDELQSDVDTRATQTDLNNHVNDTTDAHDASAISVVPTGNLAADDVQEALVELQTDIDGLSAGSGTMTNLGTGAGVYKQKVLDEFQLRSIKAGSNITVTENADEILIDGAASGADQALSNLNPTDINQNLQFNPSSPRNLKIKDQTGLSAGQTLTIQAGGVSGLQADVSGGNLNLVSGSSTGNQGSKIAMSIVQSGQASGTTIRSPSQVLEISSDNTQFLTKFFATVSGGANLEVQLQSSQNKILNGSVNSIGVAPKLIIISGENSGTGESGEMRVESGAKTVDGDTGAVYVKSGNATNGNSGSHFIETGIVTSGTAKTSGYIHIQTGNGSGTNTSSGYIKLQTGNKTGTGTKGQVIVDARELYLDATPLVENTSTFTSYSLSPTNQLLVGGYGIVIIQSTGPITINGIEAGVQGQHLTIYNENNNAMTFNNQSGSALAQDRIVTCTGAAVSSTGTSCHKFIYLSGRWVMQSNQL